MKMRGWAGLLALLLAGLAQAVNTTATLNDKRWGQSQQGLIDYVESPHSTAAGASDPNRGASNPTQGVLDPMLEKETALPAVAGSNPTALPILVGDAMAGQPSADAIEGADGTARWENDPHVSLAPMDGPGTDFLDASSHVQLPTFADIDWVAAPLPAARKTSVMEIVVFPALGMLLLILLVTWLVLRIRRHRPVDREQQLLHV